MMRTAALLSLLALAACGGSAPNNIAAPADPAPSTMAPPPSDPAPTQAPTMSGPGDGGGPENSFIVCPGNPRCPPDGTQPKR